MKHLHYGLAGLILGTTLIQIGCATLPQTTEGVVHDAQAMQDQEAALSIAGLVAKTPLISMGKVGDPLAGLTGEQKALFHKGKAVFEKQFFFEPGDFANERSCAACHSQGGTGGAGVQIAQNVGQIDSNATEAIFAIGVGTGVPTAANGFLGHVLSNDPAFPKQPFPSPDPGKSLVISQRLTPPTAGDGVLLAIPDSQLLEREQKQNHALGISGRTAISPFEGKLGRIGWKLRTASLSAFTAGAFINELGVSNSALAGVPLEQQVDGTLAFDPNGPDISNEDLAATVAFQELSAPPAPKRLHLAGLTAFKKAGCAECHWMGYTTAKTVDELPDGLKPYFNALGGGKSVPAYTDLLAHNMGGGMLTPAIDATGQVMALQHKVGAGNSDGIQESVNSDEYRTAPLWGLRHRTRFMHDGRSKSIEEAIMQHYYVSPSSNRALDSEANKVILRYLGKTKDRRYDLSARDRVELLTFLRNL
jgi:CxxC motif-containing protein (DUF1111 family)